MRTIAGVALCLAFLCVTAPPASAQTCCGGPGPPYHINCSCGGGQYLYQCIEGSGNDWIPVVLADCGSCPNETVETYAFAGYCYNGVVSSLQRVTQDVSGAGGEARMYVKAYVRVCSGRYVPVLMAMARGG